VIGPCRVVIVIGRRRFVIGRRRFVIVIGRCRFVIVIVIGRRRFVIVIGRCRFAFRRRRSQPTQPLTVSPPAC
jgi:hypothetical protein